MTYGRFWGRLDTSLQSISVCSWRLNLENTRIRLEGKCFPVGEAHYRLTRMTDGVSLSLFGDIFFIDLNTIIRSYKNVCTF